MLNQASTANWFIRHNLRTQLRTQCFNLLWNQKKYIKIISLDYIYLYTKTIIKCPLLFIYLVEEEAHEGKNAEGTGKSWDLEGQVWFWLYSILQSPRIIEFILLCQTTQLYIIRDLKLSQNTPSEEYSFIMTPCSISEYCLLTLDHNTLFMGSKIKLLNLSIKEVQRNLIIFPLLTNQCFSLSFF